MIKTTATHALTVNLGFAAYYAFIKDQDKARKNLENAETWVNTLKNNQITTWEKSPNGL